MILNAKRNSLKERDISYEEISKKLFNLKTKNKNFKVLNVGGSLDRIGLPVDAIFDIRGKIDDKNNKITIYPYDICKKDSWESIKNKEFDYVVCTHTLEDVRDPYFVIEQIQRVGKAGYIAVPSKTRELQFCRSYFHIGYAHHRWIFSILDKKLLMMPKFSFVEYLVKTKKINWTTKPTEPKLLNLMRFFRYKFLEVFKKNNDIFFISLNFID